MATKLVLTASVEYQRGQHIACVSIATVRLGGEPVARGTLAGRYDATQAVKEFRKNPRKFGRFDTRTDLVLIAKAA
jgi:hypothetical protein